MRKIVSMKRQAPLNSYVAARNTLAVDETTGVFYMHDGTTVGGTAISTTPAAAAARLTPVALVDGPTIAVDFSTGLNFTVLIAGNRAVANPVNAVPGTVYRIQVTQDATGSRTLTWGNQFKLPAAGLTLSTAANAVDHLFAFCRSAGVFEVRLVERFAS